ncbi:hypothetical protein CDAR_276541 [Caerostris darwini]|uniref:Uncharacterized protein n=1 Tax=Caerostris darwini TaxID=1538125 RepID=A0AAV4MY48_9ARAC|nr:hypothetical protein CDAR_276541 [Caerostris darwini]
MEIITIQSAEIAKLKGRLLEKEESLLNQNFSRPIASNTTYADKVKSGNTTERSKSVNRNKVAKKYITTAKLKGESNFLQIPGKWSRPNWTLESSRLELRQVRNIRNDYGPRAALVIRSTLETQAILVTRHIVIVHLNTHNLDCLLISTYCPPKGNLMTNLDVLQPFLEKYINFKTYL